MPYVDNDGVRIYFETEGAGDPLLLHVGFFGTLDDWRLPKSSYVAGLRDTHRLILIDPRGQGRSDKPHEPSAYTMANRTSDVIAVLDRLDVDRVAFWGYSLGGRVAFELALRYPERLSSMIAGGANLYREVDPDNSGMVDLLSRGMASLVREWEQDQGPLPPPTRERWLANDPSALMAAWRSGDQPHSDVVDALATMTTPSLLYVGASDHDLAETVRPASTMPNATLATIAGANHQQAYQRHDLVLPHVMGYLNSP